MEMNEMRMAEDMAGMTCTQPTSDWLGGRMYTNVNVIAQLGLDSGNELWVCDDEWYVKSGDYYYPTCVYYDPNVDAACDSSMYVCAQGSRADMNAALRGYEPLDAICYNAGHGLQADFMNRGCPRIQEKCAFFSNYFIEQLTGAGVSTEEACSLCVPDNGESKTGAVKMVTREGYKSICVGYSDESLTQCPVDYADDYMCAGARGGYQIFGWPSAIASAVKVALEQPDQVHPQCRDYMMMPMP